MTQVQGAPGRRVPEGLARRLWLQVAQVFTGPARGSPWVTGGQLTRSQRVRFTIIVAIASGLAAGWLIGRPGHSADLLHVWFGSRILLSGSDPYSVPLPVDLNPFQDPALYPLPTYLLFAPLALLPIGLAGGLFMALGAALAAWGISGTGTARTPLFLSAPFLLALTLGQWSPLLLGALLVPGAAWLLVTKPNIGLAAWLATPRWTTALAVLFVIVVSVLAYPGWPAAWLQNISGREEKFVPLFRPGGFLLLAAVVAWRRPEGRLLLSMSLIPQALFFYDQLLLWLVPRTLRQSMLLSLLSLIAFLAWFRTRAPGDQTVNGAVPYAQSLYFAAAAILLWNWWNDRKRARNGMTAPPDVGQNTVNS